ncbi:MAG: hypothetical protein GY774_38435 [Planctomycetes bacterium]|nr:hypothetical protein [Planctomycetota bacterium]
MFDKNKTIGSSARVKQAKFLTKYVLLCPVWTFFWYLDEIFYSGYKKLTVRPVFIIGQPRSGTTLLHRTLAVDKNNFVAIRHIEWRFPYIFVQKFLSRSRYAKKIINKNYWPDSSAGRIAAEMHTDMLSDCEEDGIFFEECFLHHFFVFLRFPYPHLLQYLDEFPLLPEAVQLQTLETHRKVIQKIMFLHGCDKKYYLSKEVTSHNRVQKILKLYPDAKFIVNVRNSSGFMNSLLSLARFSTMSKTGIDPLDIPMWESVFVDRMKKDSHLLSYLCDYKIKKSNQVRIMFNRLTEDIFHSIEDIYKQLGFDLCHSYRNHLQLLNKHQEVRKRGYNYEENNYQGFDEFDEFVKKTELEFSHSLFEIKKHSFHAEKEFLEEINTFIENNIKKRCFQRVNTSLQIEFKCNTSHNGEIAFKAVIENLSEGGVFINQINALNKMTKESINVLETASKELCEIHFSLNGSLWLIETKGEWVWVERVKDELHAGIRFKNMKHKYIEKIKEYLQKQNN